MISMNGEFVKVIGIKFDALDGLQIITDFNQENFKEAGKIADEKCDGDTIFIGIPCTYSLMGKN